MTTDFGTCTHCTRPAVVKLNDEPLCLDHYDDGIKAIGRTMAGVRIRTAQLATDGTPDPPQPEENP